MKFLALLLLLAAVGCDSMEPTSGSVLEGYVVLKDTLGASISDHSGVRVSILNGTQTTITAIDGQWNLPGFPFGRPFTLVFSKAGYAEERHEMIIKELPPGGNVAFGSKRMYAIQTFTPSLVTRSFEDIFQGTQTVPSYRAVFSVRIPEFDIYRATAFCVVYFSKATSIVANDPASYKYGTIMRQTSSVDGTAYFDVYADSLYASGFAKGEKVYCRGYAAGAYCAPSGYTDTASSRRIYTGFSPISSQVKSFILP